MADQSNIENFISKLEKLLGTHLDRMPRDQHIRLESKDLDYAIIIYLAGQQKRVASAKEKTFHIDIDQINANPLKILKRLASLLGSGEVIYARSTVVARIDKRVALEFQEDHHMQVAMPGKYRYGAFYKGDLVSIAVFSGGRRMNDKPDTYRSFELIRFCHKSGCRVVGGLTKLINAFRKDFCPGDIMTYVDRDWSQDSSLHAIGFIEKSQTSSQSYWIVDDNRYLINTEEKLQELQSSYPSGYLKQNSGSSKLVLTL